MILAAAERMNLDLSRSWIVGDKAEDLDFAVTTAANLADAVAALIETGRASRQ